MFRSGFVAIVGRPNVGKSTLLNRLVGEKIAITSPVSQTTRHRIRGVVTTPQGQIVFLDTPGFSKPVDRLGEYLVDEATAAVQEADAFMVVMDGSQPPGKGDEWVAQQVLHAAGPDKLILLIINKVDQVKHLLPEARLERRAAYAALFGDRKALQVLMVSAKTGKQVDSITQTLVRALPEGPAYYPEDAMTDQRLREMVAEIIRERVLHHTREEIPHSVAVGIEAFLEDEAQGLTRITATLYVDQKSQKGILIGAKGQMVKTIGTEARQQAEILMGGKVHLELTVKVKENWRKDAQFLKMLGLAPPSGV
jgi:GTP-binding protein Era